MADATAILRRYGQLEAAARTYWNTCQEIAERVVPHKSNVIIEREPNAEKTEYLFDSTAVHACKNLAATIHGTMTPSTQPWISFAMRDDELNENQAVREWLEDCANRIHKALRQSNFNTSVHEMDWDLVAFGTGCMLVEEKETDASGGFTGFRFTTIPPGHYVAAEDKDGRVDTVFRKVRLSQRAVLQQFGPKACGEAFTTKALAKPDDMVTIIHGVYPRRDRAYNPDGTPKGGKKNMPWVSCYVLQEPKRVLDEGGFEEFPFVVPRWSKTTGETYGTGPSHIALPDIKTLNAFVYFMLQAIPLAMQPPTMERSDSVIGDPDLTPGGRNYIETSGPISDSFAFMDTKYRPDIAADFRVQFAEAILKMYHANEMQLREGPQMTATEVQVRYELMQRLLGPTTGRLESEFLNPFTWRCFAILARRGALKPLPGVLQQAVGSQSGAADLDVEYEGPLARAQRTIEITAQDRVIAFVIGITEALAAVNPSKAAEVWDVLKLDKFTRDRAAITGLPADSLFSDEEVQAVRGERQAAEKQRADLEGAMKISETARNLTPVMEAARGGSAKGTGKAA